MGGSKHTAYIVDTDGKVTTHDGPVTLAMLQDWVGGNIEMSGVISKINNVSIPEQCTVYINEVGLLIDLPTNKAVPRYRGPLVIVQETLDGDFKAFALAL